MSEAASRQKISNPFWPAVPGPRFFYKVHRYATEWPPRDTRIIYFLKNNAASHPKVFADFRGRYSRPHAIIVLRVYVLYVTENESNLFEW